MARIKKALIAMVLGLGVFGSTMFVMNTCYSPTYYKSRAAAAADLIVASPIDQAMLDEAWQEALKVGGGNPEWKVPVNLDHVILVPSTLGLGQYIYYGITITQPVFEDGKLTLVETIEIHLAKNMQCHTKQVLIHELLHTVATRRQLTDHDFAAAVEKAGDEEKWVRQTYPIVDMGLCK